MSERTKKQVVASQYFDSSNVLMITAFLNLTTGVPFLLPTIVSTRNCDSIIYYDEGLTIGCVH